uniref:Uncharacterized protein n=1 Tax=Siphoviridae sp. ctr4Z12 TaxID=2827280 RepID=A0A8S5R518_9CAUD|nr:MAG TPA: hypothetical protein [Siphoviridae sp. ctr4Z12]
MTRAAAKLICSFSNVLHLLVLVININQIKFDVNTIIKLFLTFG